MSRFTGTILWILSAGLLPLCLIAMFTTLYTAIPTMILLGVALAYVQYRNNRRGYQFDDRGSMEKVNAAIERYVREVKERNVED